METENSSHSSNEIGTFDSNSENFSRSTPISYAYADIFLAVLWNVGLIVLAPTWFVFLPAAITGLAAVLVDYVWFYRNGHREVRVGGAAASPQFIGWWLVFWFDFLIAWNIGSFVGLTLQTGLTTAPGVVGTVLFCAWFWVMAPTLSRAIEDAGFGTTIVTTTRRVGAKLSYLRGLWVVLLYIALLATVLDWNFIRAAELFAIGMLAAGSMELPLYMLRIRPGQQAWKAFVLNTIVEWNYATPIFFLVFYALGITH